MIPSSPEVMQSGSRLPEVVIAFWVRYRHLFLTLGIALFSALVVLSPRVPNSFVVTELLPPRHPERVQWERFKQIFGSDELVLVVYRDPQLFDPSGSGMARLHSVTQRLRAIPGVRDIWSIDQPLGNLIIESKLTFAQDLRRFFEGYTHNSHGDLCAVVVVIDGSPEATHRLTTTLLELDRVAATLPEGMLVGPPVLIHEGLRQAEADARQLLWLVAALLSIVVFAISRQIRWVIINLAIVGAAILASQATLRPSFGFASAPLASLITVVGVATLMHVFTRYKLCDTFGRSREESFILSIQQLAKPVLLSLVTDCVGFGALSFSDIQPLREFALMAVFGIGWLALSGVLFLPGLVLILSREKNPSGKAHPARRWTALPRQRITRFSRALLRILKITKRLWYLLIPAVLALGALSIGGLFQLDVETDFTRHFRKRNKLVVAYEVVEHELGGAGVWDIAVPAPRELHPDYLRAILRLEDRLRQEVLIPCEGGRRPGLTKVLSLADVVESFRQDKSLRFIRQDLMDAVILGVIRQRMPGLYRALYAPDPVVPDRWWLRIMLRSPERQDASSRRQTIKQVRDITAEEWPAIRATLRFKSSGQSEISQKDQDDDISPLVTGYFVIFSVVVESMLRNQNITFLGALVGMICVFWLAFRRIWTVLALILCNTLPIIFILGALGWCRIPVNFGVVMMAAISLGLSVDSSLHYATTYERLLKAGISPIRSIFCCQMLLGPPVIYATLSLCVGFLSLTTSQLVPTAVLGILLSFTMLSGLLTNVTLLPWLLLITPRNKNCSNEGTMPASNDRKTQNEIVMDKLEGDS
ncbi:MAG TPA: MMPL family transporter [Thermogutta sp.]|nr:MMPL family transporter [Thermogutta sp.]